MRRKDGLTCGYAGRIVDVDLSRGTVVVRPLEEKTQREYIGGVGLGAKILYEETTASTRPLGPENVVIFAVGPITGTTFPTSSRHAVVAKSPLTGAYAESDCGGRFGAELKRAGVDAVVVRGAAARPVYVYAHGGTVEIRDASHLWGTDTYRFAEQIEQETAQGAKVACIGPAGEKQIPIASVMSDGREARAAGRAGIGAVMGSKQLKALVAKGGSKVPVADPDALARLTREFAPAMVESMKFLSMYGTSGGTESVNKIGDLPIKNWRLGSWEEGSRKISGITLAQTFLKKKIHCPYCPIGCGRYVEIPKDKARYAPLDGGGPEYETVAAFGSMCMVDDLEAICNANDIANRLGVDTMSAGASIAFAMEAYERGLLSEKDTGGLDLTWGNSGTMLELLRQICLGEGLGGLLGRGVRAASRELGPPSEEFAIHSKGMELPMHDPRCYASAALAYAASVRGACHRQSGSHTVEAGNVLLPEIGVGPVDRTTADGKGELVAKMQDVMSLYNSFKLCGMIVNTVKVKGACEVLNAVTGWDTTVTEIMKTGERLSTLKRMYNVRCGFTRKDDTLPRRLLTLKRGVGGSATNLPHLDRMLSDYYEYRGWSEEGIPGPAKLADLGLAW